MTLTANLVEAVVFDLGNVLIEIDFGRVFQYWAECAGCSVEQIKDRYQIEKYYEKHERGEIGAAEYFAALRKTLELELSDEQFLLGWNEIFVGEMPGARALVRRYAEHFPIYAFTNTNDTHKKHWMSHYTEIMEPFRQVFVSSDMGKRKPDAQSYMHVAQHIGLAPQRILFFDDLRQNIQGAENVGMQAKQVNSVADMASTLQLLLE